MGDVVLVNIVKFCVISVIVWYHDYDAIVTIADAL